MQLGFSLSNYQKVQLNTDLFSDMQMYLYLGNERAPPLLVGAILRYYWAGFDYSFVQLGFSVSN